MSEHSSQNEQPSEPFISHLIELRNRLLWAIGAVLLMFFVLVPFAGDLYTLFAKPLTASLPEGSTMISTEPQGLFLVPFKLAFAVAFGVMIPFVLYQVWAFVAPGLYQNEKRIVLPLIVSSTGLFYLGVLFAYFAVFPLVFPFLISMAPEGVTAMPDIGSYMSIALKLFFAFGVAFEVPVATYLLARMGVVSAESMAKQRPYIVVGAFVIGMLMTPPDIFSQILLAVPVCLLFELGLFFAFRIDKKLQQQAE